MELLNRIMFMGFSGGDIGEIIFHHVGDSKPFIELNLFGLDVSITKHVIVMWIIAICLITLVLLVARSIKKDKSAIGGRLSTLIQIFVEFIHDDVVEPNFHKGAKKWMPFFLTMFFFIMFGNLFGLFPGSSTVTGNLVVTGSLSIVTFLCILVYGTMKHGPFGFWLSIVPSGVPKALWPLIFLIELVGLFTKPFALMVRLFANMVAGHVVLLVMMYFAQMVAGSWMQLGIAPVSIIAAVAVNVLELLIAVIQAYIFTFLSAIFISSAGEGH